MVSGFSADPNDALRHRLAALLAESVEETRVREHEALAIAAAGQTNTIVLYGAGGLGRLCLTALRRHGIEPLIFSDGNPRLWGTVVDGVHVVSPTEAVAQFGKVAVFVVSIWGARPSDRMSDRIGALKSLGCEHVVSFGPLLWRYPDVLPHYGVDLPHKTIQQAANARAGFELWADDASRREYVAQMEWRLRFAFEALTPPRPADIYFPPDIVQVRSDEVFVDCGAFDGDTLRQFLAVSGRSFDKIIAFEPDSANRDKLEAFVEELGPDDQRRIAIEPAAVSARNGVTNFAAGEGPASHVGEGSDTVPTVALDTYLGTQRVTFIKMDIEGAEPLALSGAADRIRDDGPILAISCYHRHDHLWSIPQFIQGLRSDYTFYLRPHDTECWDLVCYAIPASRVVANSAKRTS